MTEIEAEHQEIDYNQLDQKYISDLAKVLSLLEDYNEESSGDRRTEDGDTTAIERLALIIKTFTNIGDILYFEQSQVVVPDPRRSHGIIS